MKQKSGSAGGFMVAAATVLVMGVAYRAGITCICQLQAGIDELWLSRTEVSD